MVYMSGVMVLNTQENLKIMNSRVRVFYNGKMEELIAEVGIKEKSCSRGRDGKESPRTG